MVYKLSLGLFTMTLLINFRAIRLNYLKLLSTKQVTRKKVFQPPGTNLQQEP